VSGTVALMLQANPALTPDQIKSTLEGSATPTPGYEEYQVGAGYLNAFLAVTVALMLAWNKSRRRPCFVARDALGI
jgi:serine protease AprX